MNCGGAQPSGVSPPGLNRSQRIEIELDLGTALVVKGKSTGFEINDLQQSIALVYGVHTSTQQQFGTGQCHRMFHSNGIEGSVRRSQKAVLQQTLS